jgi:hypothetical protein
MTKIMFEDVAYKVKPQGKKSINVSLKTDTCGNGYWSREIRKVKIHKLELSYVDYDPENKFWGELKAYFNKSDWNVDKHGLIYTDDLWLKKFRSELNSIGFSIQAIKDVDYSEQGMQGNIYVSMDVGDIFIREFALIGFFGNQLFS